MTEQQIVSAYFTYCKLQKNLDNKTLKAYQIDLKQFVAFYPKPTTVTRTDMELYIEHLMEHYYDEFHVLLQDELTSSYFVTIWKMLRKKGCVPSALTQNVKDLLASRQIENIFENSDFMVLLSQAQGDRQILAKQLGISPHQLSYVTHSNPGEGLLFFGNVTIPFVDRFPKNTKLYSIMTTRPEEKEAQNE